MTVAIYDAINAFKASQTGQGNRGTAGERALARAVVVKLWQLWGEGEIGFHDLDTAFGDSHEWGFFRDDIRLDNGLTGGDVAAASVVIVHEAVHLVKDLCYIDEELACRRLELLYYEELKPPGVVYYDRRRRRRVVMLHTGSVMEQDLRTQAEFAARDQLADLIISIPEYADSLDAAWVADHARDWGGVANRWASTKGHYLRVLGDSRDHAASQAGVIVELLESVTEGQWPEVLRTAGGAERVRHAVRFAVYAGEHLRRLRAVEARPGAPRLTGG